MINQVTRAILILGSVIGGHLAYRLTRAKQGLDPELFAACDKSSVFDCTMVNNSAYAEFLGLPTAAWGLLFYLMILAVSIVIFTNKDALRKGYARLGFYLATSGFAVSLVLASISHFAIGALCEYCMYTYIVNLVLFGGFFLLNRAEKTENGDIMKTINSPEAGAAWLRLGILPAALLAGFLIILLPSGSKAENPHDNAKMEAKIKELTDKMYAEYKASDVYQFDLSATPFKGSETAPLTIVEFADFNCGHCGNMMRVLKHMENVLPGQLKIYFKQFPLDGTCNPYVPKKHTGSSCIAASAVLCAGGRFWDMHDNIFMSQNEGMHTRPRVTTMATKMGLNMTQFNACLDSQATKNKIAADAGEGEAAQVHATPSLYVNGKKLPNAAHPILMQRLLQKILLDQNK